MLYSVLLDGHRLTLNNTKGNWSACVLCSQLPGRTKVHLWDYDVSHQADMADSVLTAVFGGGGSSSRSNSSSTIFIYTRKCKNRQIYTRQVTKTGASCTTDTPFQ